MKKLFRPLIAILLCALFSGCGALASASQDFFAMDTFMNVTVWNASQAEAQATLAQAQSTVNHLSNVLSRQLEAGDIAKLNAANGEPVSVDAATYDAIAQAVSLAKLTDGAFDPTTGILSILWGIGTENAAVPTEAEISEALTHVGYENIVLLENHQVQLLNGAQIDLGGIGKGYATDCIAPLAAESSMLVRLGGNIGAYGENPQSEDGLWTIGLADPEESSEYLATVRIQNQSVVTSGDYERYFEQDGVRYHHIFDATTGYPAQNTLHAVTVIAESSTQADALTTALFVMGLEKGMEFCEEQNISAIFLTKDHKLYPTQDVTVTLAEGVDYEIITQLPTG